MKLFSTLALALSLSLSLGVHDADAAKRLGGGKSVGMQRQSTAVDKAAPGTPPQAAPAQAAQAAKAPAAAPATPATPPKRSWMGPLAGLAAGIGLAALASHFGFGEELASMMMIGLLVVAVLAVIGFVMRKRAGAAAGAPSGGLAYAGAAAGAGGGQYAAPQAYSPLPASNPAAGGSMIGSQLAGGGAGSAGAIPADFDAIGFARQAEQHFRQLQSANDAGRLDELQRYTTPDMFEALRQDILARGTAVQHTEVQSVQAEVLEVLENADGYVVSVRFSGRLREDAGAAFEDIAEIWHLSKPRFGAGGWLLSGIQQLS